MQNLLRVAETFRAFGHKALGFETRLCFGVFPGRTYEVVFEIRDQLLACIVEALNKEFREGN